MAGASQEYRFETATVIRGREASTIARKQASGWELHERDQGRVRATLTFRKAKEPLPRGLIALGVMGAVVLIVVLGVVAALDGFDDAADENNARGDSAAGQDTAAAEGDSAGQSEEPGPSASESGPQEDVEQCFETGRNAAIDLGLTDGHVIIEAKVVQSCPIATIREAIGQLYEYRYFQVCKPDADLVFLADQPVPAVWIRYFEKDRRIGVIWFDGGAFHLSPLAEQILKV